MIASYICVPKHVLSQFIFSSVKVVNLREREREREKEREREVVTD
jgi:hypothetical protein